MTPEQPPDSRQPKALRATLGDNEQDDHSRIKNNPKDLILSDTDMNETDNASVTTPASRRARRALVMFVVIIGIAFAFSIGRFIGDGKSQQDPDNPQRASSDNLKEGTTWTCSMHPQIQSSEPGQCAMCGMDLIPNEANRGQDLTADQVRLTERARILARIQTSMVKPQASWGEALRLLGRLDYDETRTRTVTPWTGGRIDRLHVATTGQKVRRGQTVATVYSPEIFAAQQDLILANQQLERLDGATPLAQEAARATLEAARNRLRLLGITRGELKRMEKAAKPWQKIPIRSPFTGTVVERLVDEGQYISAGTGLYRLVELSKLWVQLDAYEQDLPYLNEESPVELTFKALPGQRFEGKIAFIDPVVNRHKRTARVRVEISNDDGNFRPGMFAEAIVRVPKDPDAQPPLLIPDSAPLFSGRRSLVYVEVGRGDEPTYEAREVRLGPKMGDRYPVIAGLEYGERVVTHGAFRLDADLQLRGGNSLMRRPDDTIPGAYDAIIEIKPSSQARLAPIVTAYLNAQESFTEDNLDEAKIAIKQLIQATESLGSLNPAAAEQAWESIERELLLHARVLSGSTSLNKARVAFDAVTVQIKVLLGTFGNPTSTPVLLAFCPMAFNNRGAEWFQRSDAIQNAYFGSSMLSCGEIKDIIEAGNYIAGPVEAPASAPNTAPASAPNTAPASAPNTAPASAPNTAPASAPNTAPASIPADLNGSP